MRYWSVFFPIGVSGWLAFQLTHLPFFTLSARHFSTFNCVCIDLFSKNLSDRFKPIDKNEPDKTRITRIHTRICSARDAKHMSKMKNMPQTYLLSLYCYRKIYNKMSNKMMNSMNRSMINSLRSQSRGNDTAQKSKNE